jgi:hypothetical protein
MKIMLTLFRTLGEGIFVIILLILLWVIGFHVGLHGVLDTHDLTLYELSKWSTLLLLYGVIELVVSVALFIALKRQMFPSGKVELISLQMTLANKAHYFPGIFTLGVFAGLACHAVVTFVLIIIF